MSGRFQGHQTTLWRAEQLEQVRVARRVLAKRAGATEHLPVFTHHCHHVTLGSNVDSRKPYQPSSFHDPVPGASEPELTLLLVHSRTPLAPLDTVRALSPGRGRQSSAQGFTFSTAGGDTSPGNLAHLSRSHWWLAAIGLVGQEKESWPASADRRGFASRILNPSPRPTTFFPRPPDRVRGRGKKCSVPLSRQASRSIGSGHHTSTTRQVRCANTMPILLLSKTVSLARPAARSARASRNLRTDLQFSFERSARKKLRGESKAQHALPDDGSGRRRNNDATQVQMRSQVDHRPVSGQMRRAELPTPINAGNRAFYYPGDRALYGSDCGHGEKAERDFAAHRIDEDGY